MIRKDSILDKWFHRHRLSSSPIQLSKTRSKRADFWENHLCKVLQDCSMALSRRSLHSTLRRFGLSHQSIFRHTCPTMPTQNRFVVRSHNDIQFAILIPNTANLLNDILKGTFQQSFDHSLHNNRWEYGLPDRRKRKFHKNLNIHSNHGKHNIHMIYLILHNLRV